MKYCHFNDHISVDSSSVSPVLLTSSSRLPRGLEILAVMMNGWTMYIGRDNVDKTVSWCGISAVRLGWGVAFFLSIFSPSCFTGRGDYPALAIPHFLTFFSTYSNQQTYFKACKYANYDKRLFLSHSFDLNHQQYN